MIRLDLNDLDFIDVSGVRVLYDLHFDAAAADCSLTISQAPQTTRWILNVLGLDDLFAMSVREARENELRESEEAGRWGTEPAIDGRRRRHAEPGS
jgi:anti-anti-sigma regulatory factor